MWYPCLFVLGLGVDVGRKTRPLHEMLTRLVITENAFRRNFLIFDEKQQPKNI